MMGRDRRTKRSEEDRARSNGHEGCGEVLGPVGSAGGSFFSSVQMMHITKNTITDEGLPNNMGPDQEFMMDWFHRYYSSFNPLPPSQLDKREFGFMFFDHDFVQRHIGFNSTYDLQKYLMSQVPSHVYYSSAYYQFPGASTMGEKSWTGADLILDLDADHIKGAQGGILRRYACENKSGTTASCG